ncbi:hypothetical protein Tco_0859914 [Tanacetum coccineum]|uniref:Uncharacterized protein n=1 Tax=Tanacetum coccineum TaxID=301880 RepID=A0ABQ5BFP0_9ASTR
MFSNESKEKEAKNIDTEIALEKKVKELDNILNRSSEDFGKRFVPQRELFDEQALHPITDQSASSPVKIEAHWELPKISLVNTSLKKLKYHLGQFDNVVKKQIMPDDLTEGEWGFEHTKDVFQKEIIPFLKTLKDIINVFDKDLLNEVKNNREAYEYYLKHTMEQAAILREVVEQAKLQNPLDSASYSACMYVKLIQEWLGYIKDTCLDIHKPRVNPSTSASRSKPSDTVMSDSKDSTVTYTAVSSPFGGLSDIGSPSG